MELFPFQVDAARQIADRFHAYRLDPLARTTTVLIPFYQNLYALTGSGKTLILADTIEELRERLPVEPIILWLSRGRVVVWQTLTNLTSGKYSEFFTNFTVKPILDCKPNDVEDSRRGLILVATVGKFNQKDKEEGGRKIFRVCLDTAEESLWTLLKNRKDSSGRTRPLIVIYDEGHNLSDQQTQLILELNPDALIAASATTRVPQALSSIINRLKQDKGWRDEDFVTKVSNALVVNSGLIKKNIMLGGYITPMETAVDDMLSDMKVARDAAIQTSIAIEPKAIYVCNTNTVDGSDIASDLRLPFKMRKARPIVIWRHLVEQCKIDPREIAIYCDLKFDSRFPPPPSFNLFCGDNDYDRFVSSRCKHIIFNLTLQEGWDDPECYFAYIDKDMGSPDQVTQIVGRVLRQPGALHYPAAVLNTAHFYIRTDEKGVFEEILADVRRKISSDCPDVSLIIKKTGSTSLRCYKAPVSRQVVPTVSIYSETAYRPISDIINSIIDFRGGGASTVGKGDRIKILQTIGSDDCSKENWVDVDHSNPVRARWIFRRELTSLFSGNHGKHPINLCDIENEKFEARVEYHSPAAQHLREKANSVVSAYIDNSVIMQSDLDHPYVVGSIAVDENKLVRFTNSLHEGYGDLNSFEELFARELDRLNLPWCRNPSQGGYSIPLLCYGRTKMFYPDFLVWKDGFVFAIDPKGDHLIQEDSTRKLFDIQSHGDCTSHLIVRLVTEGNWSVSSDGMAIKNSGIGFGVWKVRQGKRAVINCTNVTEAVSRCLD